MLLFGQNHQHMDALVYSEAITSKGHQETSQSESESRIILSNGSECLFAAS